MANREGRESTIICPDGVERTFRSDKEIQFMEYCQMFGWEILNYGDKSYEIIPGLNKTNDYKELENKMYKTGLFMEFKQMRKQSNAVYTPDFLIKIDGEEFIVEVKSYYKNSVSKADKELATSYQLRKKLFLNQYNFNFLEVSTDSSGNSLTCLYYIGNEKTKKIL